MVKKSQRKIFLEMFDPIKARTQEVCAHCGQIIPTGTYYEDYRNKPYHLECIWDKLINKTSGNTYSDAEKFFFSLQKHIGRWPAYGLDVQEDYISDLELVKANNRYLKRQPRSDYKVLSKSLEYYGDDNETI